MRSFLSSKYTERLDANPLVSLNMKGFFENHRPLKLVEINNSFMACGKSDELWWYIHCMERDDFLSFLDRLGKGLHYFAVISDWMKAELELMFNIESLLSCKRFYLPSQVVLPNFNHTLSDLLVEDTRQIFENSNYKAFTSPEYISSQIKIRPGVAYRDKGTLVGWVMFHDDGAVGLLHVLEKYRRQGIARALVAELCRRLRQQIQIPYTSVEPTNTASLAMVNSLGFCELDNINWCKVVK